ncbi:maleylpyruvate isomerase N-terminal domain-containing protein [Pseudonocardia phyllosphaerae]|uniref:maleylpyruvate isomerase N-terminal domain-containing protein n=1 Tax=Pseudonocardia phyllosphaerae TaxID=3390502 RepID=UPI003979159B
MYTASGPAADAVTAATGAVVGALRPHTGLDWSVPAGPLTWSCHETAVHVADDLFGYATQVLTEPVGRYAPYEIAVPAGTTPDGLLDVVAAGGAVLAAAVRTAPPSARGWHPYGTSDPGGFAAMGVVELLVHADDLARGLGVAWSPEPDAVRPVLARLWPGVDPGPDPAATLLHHTGRAPLGGVPAPQRWRWWAEVPRHPNG